MFKVFFTVLLIVFLKIWFLSVYQIMGSRLIRSMCLFLQCLVYIFFFNNQGIMNDRKNFYLNFKSLFNFLCFLVVLQIEYLQYFSLESIIFHFLISFGIFITTEDDFWKIVFSLFFQNRTFTSKQLHLTSFYHLLNKSVVIEKLSFNLIFFNFWNFFRLFLCVRLVYLLSF